MTMTLGGELQRIRKMRGLTLKAAAEPARLSPAYLHKLEGGNVKSPSPSVLQRLADVLGIDYPELLVLAGHPLPAASVSRSRQRGSLLRTPLQTEALTVEEADQLARYLAFLRQENVGQPS
jgi:transcriptional regulator with XRE-family HTH domain